MGFHIHGRYPSTGAVAGQTAIVIAITAAMAAVMAGGYAPNRWVSATADGNGDGVLTPWTWQQAYTLSAPGDVIEYAAGTYYAPLTNVNRLPTFLPNAGSPGQPIIHYARTRAVHTSNPALRSNWRLNGGIGPVTGMANHVVFDGFDVAQIGAHAITSEGHAIGLWNVASVAIRYCRFDAVLSTLLTGTNWGAIYGEDVVGVEISDCEFLNFNGTTHHNHSAVMFYDTSDYDIHHCVFTDCAGAVFPKGVHSGADPDLVPGAIHHCKMTDVSNPLPLGGVGQNESTATPRMDFYQNLLVRCGMITTRAHPRNVRIVNNTFFSPNVNEAVFYTPGGYTVTTATPVFNYSMFQNNLIVDPSTGALWMDYDGAATLSILAARMTFDYNMYRSVTSYHKGGSWATWTSAGMDAHGTRVDPLFENEVGEDLRLATGSPALGAGMDALNLLGVGIAGSINLGCYILPDQSDSIGIRSQ